MAPLLSASRRALLRPTTAHVLLDVLAPATFAALSLAPTRSASSSSASAPSTASTTQVRPEQRSAAPASPTTSKKKGKRTTNTSASTSASPSRQRRNKPRPSPHSPSAVDLLSQIRNSSPSSAVASSSSVQSHNEALFTLFRGIDKKRRDFLLAFKSGWLPLRNAGQVARLQPQDLAKVLRACSLVGKDGRAGQTDFKWEEVKELVLWLAGERDMPGVVEWAWAAVELGDEGCAWVVEVWEAIARGEQQALRKGDKAINWAYQPKQAFTAATAAPPSAQKPPVFLFAAYVAARFVVHSRLPPLERPKFADVLPSFLDPRFPVLHRWLNHPEAANYLSRAFSSPFYSTKPDLDPSAVLSSATSWIRQVALAQLWYSNRAVPAVELVKHVRGCFSRSAHMQAWEMWEALREAVDSEELAWIGTERWEESARERWVSKEAKEFLEQQEVEELSATTGAETAIAEAEETTTPDSDSPSSDSPPVALPPAFLTQALVTPFLTGFIRNQLLAQANAIWSWLASRSPPLTPGVGVWTGLLLGYARRGDTHAVENAWNDMTLRSGLVPNLSAWTARVAAYFEAKKPDEAMKLARTMMDDPTVRKELLQEHDGRFPPMMWSVLAQGLLSNGRKAEAEALLKEMDDAGTPPSIGTVNLFLKYHTRGGRPDLPAVVRLLKLVQERQLEADVFTFTMVLTALLASGHKDATAKLIAIMEASRVKPTVTTYGAIVHSLADSGEPEHLAAAVQLLDEMEQRKMATNEIIYTSLIQGFLRAIPSTPLRSPVQAENEDNQHPYVRAALTLKQRMERRGIQTNRVGYNAFLAAALSLQSEWGTELALQIWKEMKRRPGLISSSSSSGPEDNPFDRTGRDGKFVTVSDTWYVLLDGFVKMGDWGRARAVVREMEATKFEVRNKGLRRLVERVQGGRVF
ncbi:hypothetical protein JCM1840_000439 [Sporobolomyces johnsonii]